MRGRHDADRGRSPARPTSRGRVVDVAVEQPGPGRGHEQRRRPGGGAELGRAAAGSGAARRRVVGCSGQLPGLAELAVAHHQPSGGEVDVAAVERDRLAHPDPGHRQQPDQGRVGGPPQRGAQRAGGRDQRGDLGVGIQVGGGPAAAAAAAAPPAGTSCAGSGRAGRWRTRGPPRAGSAHQFEPPPAGSRAQSSACRGGDRRRRRRCSRWRGTGRAASPGGPAGSPARGAARGSRPAPRAAGRSRRATVARPARAGPAPRSASLVDLGVDRRGQRRAVPQHLPDLGQRAAGAQHRGGRGVPQPVRVDRPSPARCPAANTTMRDPAGGQRPMRARGRGRTRCGPARRPGRPPRR